MHTCFDGWLLALAEKKCLTESLINNTFNPGVPGGPHCQWPSTRQGNIEISSIIEGSTF